MGGMEPNKDVFDIPSKPSSEALRRWRRATISLNAARRFRYTANLDALEESRNELPRTRFRKGGNAVLALNRFIEAGKNHRRSRLINPDDAIVPQPQTVHDSIYDVDCQTLCNLHESADVKELEGTFGGVFGIARALNVDPERGISGNSEEIELRKLAFGSNTYPEKPQKSFWAFLYEASQDKTLIILMGCAILSFVAGMATEKPSEGWYEGSAIAFAILLVIFVTAISDYRQSLQFRSLNAEKSNIKIQVFRDGRRQPISIFELVVGDVVHLSIGDQVPADGLFVSGHSLSIDESSMTGESHPRQKDIKRPFLLSGCKVSDGYGTMLVTGVGLNTEWGKVMATLSDDQNIETPLQVRLNGLATKIGKFGLSVAFVVLVILLIRFGVNYEKMKALNVVKKLVHEISIAVTIVVVAVPEGLPLAVTITLAYSMRKMMADKALVRKLSACETMGSSTTICSDKTGTLTMNQMTVLQAWVAGALESSTSKEIWDTIFEGVVQNSSGSVFTPPNGGEPEVSASPTEGAILTWCLKMGMDYDRTKKSSTIIAVESFNSEKKRAGVLLNLGNGKHRVHWKGAAEILLKNCSYWIDSDYIKQSISQDKMIELEKVIKNMASSSLRCIALCYLDLEEGQWQTNSETESVDLPDTELTLIGIVGLKDPCRPNVPEAVASCQRAGVKVRMITGDNVVTAKAIASECGILTPDGIVIEGKDFRVMPEEQLLQILPRIDVMARSSPTDKHLMVKLLRSMDEVVAVTGDGTNDAPALHEADIGLAMGISGTEVAKESSDIVILDDNFASIVKVLKWGRSVYANIQKFIQFQLTVNIAALTINFVAAIHEGDVPLTAVQLLWVNLIMDTLGALALATEPPTDRLLDQKPVGRKAPLITNIMWRNLFTQAAYQLCVLLTLHFKGASILNLTKEESGVGNKNAVDDNRGNVLNTIIFNSFVFCQIFNEINSRKPDRIDVISDIYKNKMFCSIIIISVAFQIVIVEFLQNFASTKSLSLKQWGICIVIGFVSMPLSALMKLVPVPKTPLFDYFKWKSI